MDHLQDVANQLRALRAIAVPQTGLPGAQLTVVSEQPFEYAFVRDSRDPSTFAFPFTSDDLTYNYFGLNSAGQFTIGVADDADGSHFSQTNTAVNASGAGSAQFDAIVSSATGAHVVGLELLATGAGAFASLSLDSAVLMSFETAKIGFHGATPVAQAAHPTVLGDVITLLTNLGLCA